MRQNVIFYMVAVCRIGTLLWSRQVLTCLLNCNYKILLLLLAMSSKKLVCYWFLVLIQTSKYWSSVRMPVERQFVALSTCWLVAVAEPMPQGMGRASTLRKINEPLYFPLVTTGRQSCEPMPHGKSTNFGKKGDHLYFPLVWKNATRHGKRTHLGGRHCSTEQDPKEYKK